MIGAKQPQGPAKGGRRSRGIGQERGHVVLARDLITRGPLAGIEHLQGGELTVTLWRGIKAAQRQRRAA